MNQLSISFDVNDQNLRNDFFSFVLPEAIKYLEDTMSPKWGLMTAQQMLEHLVWNFEIATGKIEVICGYPEAVSGRFKSFIFTNQPTPREFKNPLLVNSLPALRFENLTEARKELNIGIKDFIEYYNSSSDIMYIHPVFGLLSVDEWHRSSYKHCFHHLLQFDLICLKG